MVILLPWLAGARTLQSGGDAPSVSASQGRKAPVNWQAGRARQGALLLPCRTTTTREGSIDA